MARDDRTLNWQQACDLLDCSKSHFYNLVNSGEIPAHRTGRVKGIRVYERDVRRYLRLRRVECSL